MSSAEERLERAIGRRLRELRKSREGLTQEKLAHGAGFDPSFVGRVERGTTAVTVNTVEALCAALEVSLAEFFRPLDKAFGLRGPRRRRKPSTGR